MYTRVVVVCVFLGAAKQKMSPMMQMTISPKTSRNLKYGISGGGNGSRDVSCSSGMGGGSMFLFP